MTAPVRIRLELCARCAAMGRAARDAELARGLEWVDANRIAIARTLPALCVACLSNLPREIRDMLQAGQLDVSSCRVVEPAAVPPPPAAAGDRIDLVPDVRSKQDQGGRPHLRSRVRPRIRRRSADRGS
jgi:hypothetical protein